METEDLTSWAEFAEKKIEYLEGLRGVFTKAQPGYVSGLLFRGQADSSWPLTTTLERYTEQTQTPASSYFRTAMRIKPQIETYTGRRWDVELEDLLKWSASANLLLLNSFPGLDYLIYLRHHGFPLPFLDWSKSPFVAAFFAFAEVPRRVWKLADVLTALPAFEVEQTLAKRVAIFAYMEFVGQGKTQEADDPMILTLPANVRSHRRHFIQQSEYTVCAARPESDIIFSSHEEAFPKTDADQNLLWKYTLPVSERINVLRKLDQMNVNSLSLFDNEESLMTTAALREYYLENEAR